MAIFYCPKCNKRYFVENEINEEFTDNFECDLCHYSKKNSQLNESLKKHNTACNEKSIKNNSLDIEYQKLNLLKDIRKMMKFFYIVSIISLILSIIGFFL